MLEAHSVNIHKVWTMPPGQIRGEDDQSPIELLGITAVDFERFLYILYPP